MAKVEQRPVDREESLLDLLFFHRKTRKVARDLLEAMKANGGTFSQKQMGQFVKELEARKPETRFSKRNFYPNILRRFIGMGLIAETTVLDERSRKAVKVYQIQVQPTTGHRPTRPSFLWLAYVASEIWNEEFLGMERPKSEEKPDG